MERFPRRYFVLALLAVACSGDQLVLPAEGDPGSIEALAGNGQNGQVGGTLPESLVVRVTDSHDRPIQNQPVEFIPTGDPTGQLLPDTVLTDASGQAAARWRLGTESGPKQAEARVVGVPGRLAVTFSATADPAPPDSLDIVGGNNQAGQIGDLLPDSLEVALIDDYGNPIEGADVQWASQNGSVSSSVVTTGSNGRAAVQWTLGLIPGTQRVTATYGSVNGSPVTFIASATVGPPPRLVIFTQPSLTAIAGTPFAQQPLLQVEDNLGNPILQGGISVTATIASGGGTLGGNNTLTTDNTGKVQYTDLMISGPTGTRTLIFAATGHTSATSRPIDITASTPNPNLSTLSVTPGTITASTGSSSGTITVTAKDGSDNPVIGAVVVLSSTGGGNQLTQPAVTNASGVATGLLSSTVSEVKTVSATVAGVAIAQTVSITVVPGPADPASTTAVVPNGRIFQKTLITVTAHDQWGNSVGSGGSTVLVTVSGSNRRNPITATDNGDGTYTASYTPFGLGTDTITITLDGSPIAGSPFTSSVGF
jgi:hypothetical protein